MAGRNDGSTQVKRKHGQIYYSLIVLLGVASVAVGALGAWNSLQFAIQGAPASGRVLEFHNTSSSARNLGVVMEVEVTMAGHAPFRQEIEANLPTVDWIAGKTTLPLSCVVVGVDGFNCRDGSGVTLLLPIVLLGMGALTVWWSFARARGRRE